jgi:predicted N-acyltransferase
MSIEVEVRLSLDAIDKDEYQSFHQASRASFFYDWRFLSAAERSPLLAVSGTYYFLARDNGRLVAFLPAYLQSVSAVDPFGLLARTADIRSDNNQRGLFSHVMHCFDSHVVALPGTPLLPELLAALNAQAANIRADYVGLLNVCEAPVLQELSDQQFAVNHLVDRYYSDVGQFKDFNAVLKALPKHGRWEMTRQLRKFADSSGSVTVLEPPFDPRLEQLTQMCQQTTAKNGTPQYFPAEALALFVRTCAGLVRIFLAEEDGVIVGGFICFLDGDMLCVWSAGMRYDLTEYSPYTVCFAHTYQWAIANGVQRIEAGRLNERIKVRLGLKPMPLYSATRQTTASL